MTHEEVLQSNKAKNIAYLSAQNAKFGFGRQMPRTQNELEKVNAGIENNLLSTVHSKAKINDVVDAQSELIDQQSNSIDAEKQPKNTLNDVVTGSFSIVHEKVDCREFFDLSKPFVDDGTQLEGKEPSIEATLHDHFDLENTSIEHGTHLSVTEVITKCGLTANKANSNVVAALLKNTGHNYCKSKGKRGYWVTTRL